MARPDARAPTRRLGLVAPSGYLPDAAVADRCARWFAARGWQVQAGETIFARELRFAGSDELRAAELQAFASDPRLDVVMMGRGGYGLTRLLDRLDFAAIRAAERVLVGYSDFTAFSLAYLARAGGVSFQGPDVNDFGRATPEADTVEQFFATLAQPRHALEFACEPVELGARGRLWGGNLAMVCALLATPYFPRVRGGILFLEDVNEPAYKVERMLLQLHQAGVLDRQAAVLLGAFEPMAVMPTDNGYGLTEALARVRAATRTPILTGLPFGHVACKATLPVGARARLAVAAGRARLEFWDYPWLG
jgi:muramoyltetrapeptide carboxypeptidase